MEALYGLCNHNDYRCRGWVISSHHHCSTDVSSHRQGIKALSIRLLHLGMAIWVID